MLEWEQARLIYMNLPKPTRSLLRDAAVKQLRRPGHGISSSDINHRIMPNIMRGDYYFTNDSDVNENIKKEIETSAAELSIELCNG